MDEVGVNPAPPDSLDELFLNEESVDHLCNEIISLLIPMNVYRKVESFPAQSSRF
jgi:hypothetical protein